MSKQPITQEQVEAVATSLGAPMTSIRKWRQRGIPGDWALRIVAASSGAITAADMLAFSEAREPRAELEREGAAA